MKVLFCKIICFCRHSSHLYTPSPLRLANIPSTLQEHTYRHKHKHKHKRKHKHSVCKDDADAAAGNKHNRNRKKGLVAHQSDDDCIAIASRLQSSLRKSSPQKSESADATTQKKKVQWLDFFGKELVQIREFESREADDTEQEDAKGRGCVCSIL